MNGKVKKLLGDTFVFALGGIGSKFILFFLVPLYTNYLTTAEYGIADLILTVAQFVSPFVSLVIFDAVLRFALSKNEVPEDVFLCAIIVFFCGSVLTVALTPLFDFYTPISEWKWYLCIYVIANMLVSIELNYIKAKNKNKLFAFLTILQTCILVVANILLLVVFKMGMSGYIMANVLCYAITSVCIFLFAKLWRDIKKAKFSKSLLKQMILYSTPLILNNVSWWIIHSTDKIMIEMMLKDEALLGLYAIAAKIPTLIGVIVSVFTSAWQISSVEEIESSNDTSFYSNIFNAFCFTVFFASICLILIIKPFMKIYVGADFVSSWEYVPLLLTSAVFSAISSFQGNMYGALKKPVHSTVTTLIAALVNIVVNYVFIIYVGVWGAIIGTVAAYFVIALIRTLDVKRYINYSICWWRLICNTFILLAQSIFVSISINVYIVSSIALALFVLVNLKPIILFVKKLFKRNKKNDDQVV